MSEVVRQLVPKKRCCKDETSPPESWLFNLWYYQKILIISSSSLVGTIVQKFSQIRRCKMIVHTFKCYNKDFIFNPLLCREPVQVFHIDFTWYFLPRYERDWYLRERNAELHSYYKTRHCLIHYPIMNVPCKIIGNSS